MLGPPCQRPAAALAGLPRACTADICRIIHIFRLRGGSGLRFPHSRLSLSLPACWGGSAVSPPFPACSPPGWVSPLPAQGRGLAGDDALLCTRLLFLRTRPMPSLRCRVTPVQDRLEGLESPCLSSLLGDLREAGTAGMFLPAPASADKQSQRCCWPVGCHLGRWHQSRKDGGPALCGDRDEHSAPARRDADAAPPPYTPQNKPMSARAPSREPAGGMQD